MERAHGVDDIDLLAAKTNLATALSLQGLWEQVESLCEEILSSCRRSFGNSARRTLSFMSCLSEMVYNQGRWSHAANLTSEYLDLRQTRGPGPDKEQVSVISTNSRSHFRLAQWAEAQAALQKEIGWRADLAMIDTTEGLQARILLAMSYLKTKRQDEARLQTAEFFESFLRMQMAQGPLLEDIARLIDMFLEAHMLVEAEELLKLQLMQRRALRSVLPNDGDQEQSDEAKLRDVRRMQGLDCDHVVFSPQRLREQHQNRDDGCRTSVSKAKS